jgi:hypothetical protein
MLRNWIFAVIAVVFGVAPCWGASPLVVLSSHADLHLVPGGLRTKVYLETFTDSAPGRAFPVLSGAGALVSWKSSPTGAFDLVEPISSAPGSPAFVQKLPNAAHLELEFWLPLDATQRELVLRLPPTPNGKWSLKGGGVKAPLPGGNGQATAGPLSGSFLGVIPPEGLLWLSLAGNQQSAPPGVLEASELEVFLAAEEIRFRALIRGFSQQKSLKVFWDESMTWKPDDATDPRKQAFLGGVEFQTGPDPWFEEVFEGKVSLGKGELRLQLPSIGGLAPPYRGRVTVTPEVPRRFRLKEVQRTQKSWHQRPLPKGVQQWILRRGARLSPLVFGLSGEVPPQHKGLVISRIHAVTSPAPLESNFLFQTEVDYRVTHPGTLNLSFPPGIRLVRASYSDHPVKLNQDFRLSLPTSRPLETALPVKEPGTFRIRYLHGQAKGLPLRGELSLQLPKPDVTPGSLRWNGRLPSYLAIVSHLGGGLLRQGRLAYPIRWMKALFEGAQVVLEEAGVSVAFGLAGLLALYAFLFLHPPNQRTAYALAIVLASLALMYNLFHAASLAPGGKNSQYPDLEAQYSNPVLGRMRDAGRRLSSLFQATPESSPDYPSSPYPSGSPGRPQSEGGLSSYSSLFSPPNQKGSISDPRSTIPGQNSWKSSQAALEAPPPEPEEAPPDDWNFSRVPAQDGLFDLSLGVRYVHSILPLVVAAVLGLLLLGGLALLRSRGGKLPLLGVGAMAIFLIPLDLYFPHQATRGTSCLLAGILAVTLYRVLLDGIELWEKARRELEQRRLRALSRPGSMTRGSGDRDTGGGLYSGPNLQKNECTYDDVYRDDEGITFIMGEG